jgi:hypothetical protein
VRWLILYARSRQVPASLAAMATAVTLLWLVADDGAPRLAALALAAAVTTAAIGLSGQDLHLDRTAAIRWLPRRAAHVLLIGTVSAAALLALQAIGTDLAPTAFVLRDTAGLVGLAALAATAFGGQHAWTIPIGWFAVALFIPPSDELGVRIATWMLLPPDTPVATWTAWGLAAVGTAVYAVSGPRR